MQNIPLNAVRWSVVALLCVATSLAFAGKPKKLKPLKAKPPATASFYDSTGETKPERERRLLRECKGRPNAGACSGYAS
jgi:uncharacterized membrane protein